MKESIREFFIAAIGVVMGFCIGMTLVHFFNI